MIIKLNSCFLRQIKNSQFLINNFYFYIRRYFKSNKIDCVIKSLSDYRELIITRKYDYFLITYSYNEGYTRKTRIFHIPITSNKIFSHDNLFDEIFNSINFNRWYELLNNLNLEQTRKILKTTHGL